jgi:hypothetical protein
MISPIIYTDPYTDYEILVLEKDGNLFGAVYDPRRTGLPVPWHQNCHHCQMGRQSDLSLHIKRNIQMLCSAKSGGYVPSSGSKITQYTIPSCVHVHVLRHWIIGGCQYAHILDDNNEVLRAARAPLEKMQFEGDAREFRSSIMHRCLQFIFSGRPAKKTDLEACARPLADTQKTQKPRRGRRNICDTIEWVKVLA